MSAKPIDGGPDPYGPGFRAYNDNTAEARVQRRNAQRFSWACLIVALTSIFGIIAAQHKPTLVPYVVAINQHGAVVSVSTPARASEDPTLVTAAVKYTLRQFIEGVRGVTADSGYQAKMLTQYVQAFLPIRSGATTLVNDYYKLNNPYSMVRDKSEVIEIAADEPVAQTPTTFELHWFETTKSLDGIVLGKTEWKGYATVELHQITPEQMKFNPLGIFLNQLTWQQVGVGAAKNAEIQQQ